MTIDENTKCLTTMLKDVNKTLGKIEVELHSIRRQQKEIDCILSFISIFTFLLQFSFYSLH